MAEAERSPALSSRKLKCPRCGRVTFASSDTGGIGTRCPSCGGVHLSVEDVEQVICVELGLDPGELRAMARPYDADEAVAHCSSCEAPLSIAQLENINVDLCVRCGAGWLDHGELERLSHGRHLERKPPDAIARAALPVAVVPGKKRRRATLAIPYARRQVFRLGVLAVCAPIVFLAYSGASLEVAIRTGLLLAGPLFAAWGLYDRALRPRVVLDLARKTLRARFLPVPGEVAGLRFDDVAAVGVEPLAGGYQPTNAWTVVAYLKDGRAVRWFTSSNRVIMHRVAFQASQLLEVPVRTPPVHDEDAAP